MKQFIYKITISFLFSGLFMMPNYVFAQKADSSVQKQGKNLCKDIVDDKKKLLSVLPTEWNGADVPTIAAMLLTERLTVALVQCRCFRIIERVKELDDKTPMSLPLFLIKSTIAYYQDDNTSSKSMGITLGKTKSALLLVIKIIRTEDGEVVFANSIDSQMQRNGVLNDNKPKKKDEESPSEPSISPAMRAAIEDIVLKATHSIVKDWVGL